jgi:hypothetical protein
MSLGYDRAIPSSAGAADGFMSGLAGASDLSRRVQDPAASASMLSQLAASRNGPVPGQGFFAPTPRRRPDASAFDYARAKPPITNAAIQGLTAAQGGTPGGVVPAGGGGTGGPSAPPTRTDPATGQTLLTEVTGPNYKWSESDPFTFMTPGGVNPMIPTGAQAQQTPAEMAPYQPYTPAQRMEDGKPGDALGLPAYGIGSPQMGEGGQGPIPTADFDVMTAYSRYLAGLPGPWQNYANRGYGPWASQYENMIGSLSRSPSGMSAGDTGPGPAY